MKLEDIKKEIGADRIKRRNGITTVWKRQIKNPYTNEILDSPEELVERVKRRFPNITIIKIGDDFIRNKGRFGGNSYWTVSFVVNKLFGTITTGEY